MDYTKLKQVEIAGIIGVTPQALRVWKDAPRNADSARTYNAPAFLKWWRAQAVTTATARIEKSLEESGDALERMRELRGDILEMDRDERREETVSASDMQDMLSELAIGFRSIGDKLRRKHGNGAGDMLNLEIRKLEAKIIKQKGKNQ